MKYLIDNKGLRLVDFKDNDYSEILVSFVYQAVFARRTSDSNWTCILNDGTCLFNNSECEPLYLDENYFAVWENDCFQIKDNRKK